MESLKCSISVSDRSEFIPSRTVYDYTHIETSQGFYF